MLKNEKILLTGATGTLGKMIACALAPYNELWGLARYSGSASLRVAQELGMRPVAIDLERPSFDQLPGDFTYLLHFAHTRRGADAFPESIQVNAVGPGLLMQHCRAVKAALIVSSSAVYTPPQDVWHPLNERDPTGGAFAPWAPTSPVSKVSLEATARLAAEAFGIRTTIARLNATYGSGRGMSGGGMPIADMEAVAKGEPVRTFADPYPHSPIHFDDMIDHIEPLLAAASVPATTVNWCGDEVVTQRQWCELAGSLSTRTPKLIVGHVPGAPCGNIADATLRRSITGPCKRQFTESFTALYAAFVSEQSATEPG
ncbi:NAD(P)-dependent oxidoreductase [Sphingomonas oligophenolica]|uniref:NAD(P)-dependent oxidoreductase n=1 Tax=Sphingomonas oligophenolica TaxID=301154 RepID=A0ABU9YA61_9SPHN